MENIACDMHDTYKSICQYELGSILNYLINEKLFSLQFLNERIKFFNFGMYERNRVPLIKTERIKKCYIIISVAEMLCLVRYLEFIIGNKIPEIILFERYFYFLNKLYLILRDTKDEYEKEKSIFSVNV